MKLSELKIGEPARRALLLLDIDTLDKCTMYSKEELLSYHGVGPKAVRIIEEELLKLNLTLKK